MHELKIREENTIGRAAYKVNSATRKKKELDTELTGKVSKTTVGSIEGFR